MSETPMGRWLPALRALAGAAPDFVLLDLRGKAPAAAVVSYRSWARGVFRTRPALDEALPDSGRLFQELRSFKLPVVALADGGRHGGALGELYELAASGELPAIATARANGDGLYAEGRRLDTTPGAWIEPASELTLVVECDRRLHFPGAVLPMELELELPANGGAQSLVGLSVEPCGRALPAPAWFRIAGARRTRLIIDLAAGAAGDRWDVRNAGKEGSAVPVEPPARVTECLTHLAVIFDRTCPDSSSWGRARALAMGGVQESMQPDWLTQPALDADRPMPAAEFNGGIRSALGRALADALSSSQVDVQAWWFADTAGGGVAEPEGVELAARDFGWLGERAGREAAGLFDCAGYAPGLDLEDPVELAVEAALERLTRGGNRGRAVLVVGNSPPSGLLGEVARAGVPGAGSRRPRETWSRLLASCKANGVRMAYLFLEHDSPAPGESRDHETFRYVQQVVRSALERQMPVVSRAADDAGVVAGVRAALSELAAGRTSFSEVKVIR